MVYIRGGKHGPIKCRALLDTCASANFLTESIARYLKEEVTAHSSPISAINGMNTKSRGIVRITIQSIHDNFSKELTCLTIPTITDLVPSETFPRNSVKIPSNIRLADPDFHLPRHVDLLIGSGASLSLFAIGQIDLSREGYDLYLQKTRLGWIIAGGTSSQKTGRAVTCHLTRLEDLIQKFWEIEEIGLNKPQTEEEVECESHFIRTVSRDVNGRYTVRLPFGNTNKRLGNSRKMALKRLLSLERKLDTDAKLKNEYARVINEYLNLKHMSWVTNSDESGYYMPHHAVIKNTSNTTKVRVVFDASAKSDNGVSLNDVLMTGPSIQDKIISHLIRFRTYNYVITADIEKMYRQVLVHEQDRHFQQILWRRDGKIETLQLNTLAFGVSSSPFLAIRTIQKLAEDEYQSFPKAAGVLKSHLYVDDLLTGSETIKEARILRDDIIALLARGGFTIRQWASNDERIIHDLESTALHESFTIRIDRDLKTLGITWSAKNDKLYYATRSIEITERVTKRKILSEIAKFYDPLGLVGPVILYIKKLMQDVWRSGVHWDESIPQSIYTEWSNFARQWESINKISVDRKLLIEGYHDVQLHGFCDASSTGYGACIYIRSSNNQKTVAKLLCAKSRVAPLKTVTIPRLELCGALTLAQLFREVKGTLNINFNKIIFWCDSTIVLHWLNTAPHLLKTYVSNRVASIRQFTESHEWRHVRTEENPADAISRGQLPHDFLRNQTWFTGPSWLSKDEDEWPNEIIRIPEIPELKKNACLISEHTKFDILDRYSSYSKLIRIVSYCLRVRHPNKHTGVLQAEEINKAEIRVLKILQADQFSDEIKGLNGASTNKSKFANLNPFIDEYGLIRVGGRLQKSDLTFAQKHPILLPSRHSLTDRIIREIHEKHYHTGIQTTLYILRQRFWLPDGRNQVRKIVRTCTRCIRFNHNNSDYKMGNLPIARVRVSTPFQNTGIDFCGPFYIKEKKYRNKTRVKVYVCVFVCMTIKAIHLEVVSDLTSDGFLAALRRFAARRGLPEHVYSDNGTNFVGANNQLKDLYAVFNSNEHKKLIQQYASDRRITWHFIPPAAPHFGGLWESTVKSFKHHFKRVIGDSLFTFEELNTFVVEVEGILNSRPITSISSDPNDLLVLSPAHYLIGKPLTMLPENDYTSISDNRLSTWQHIAKVRQDFWKRWSLEYLNELQVRRKWIKEGQRFEIGAVVLIKDKTAPCAQWNLGRITRLHPGDDGISRAATIKTVSGEIKRSTALLYILPIEP